MASDKDSSSAFVGAFASLVRRIAAFAGVRGILALIYMALGAVFEGIGLILVIPLLALVIGGGAGRGWFQAHVTQVFATLGASTPLGRLSWLMAGFAALMIVRAIVVTLRDRTVMSLQIGFIESLRGEIASALADAGWSQVLRLRHARVLNIMGSDIQRISSSAHYMLQACIATVILFAQCTLSFVLSPTLALFSFALLIAGAVGMLPVLRRARRMGHIIGNANLSLLDNTSQFLTGLKMALSQDLQSGFVSEFRATLNALTSEQILHFSRQTMGRAALTTVSALVGMAVFLIGYGYLGLAPPVLIAFLLVVGRMTGPAMQIQQGFQQLAQGLPAYESIAGLLEELKAQPRMPGADLRQPPDGPIVFEAVTYQHPHGDEDQSHGVRAVSLVIPPGTVLGIAGTSGAGKTTLADLLVGLLRPQSGRISVGGAVLDDAILPAWRSRLSYISQDPFLFHDTVRRNLSWARPGVSEADMWNALTLAGADAIVRRMDGGLDAVVGERGSLVSGGERQRIALARALLRKSRLLVMDEATNAIDIDGERVLLERLLETHPRPTIIMIAHRAETLALCDRVVRMKDGRLFEDALPQAVSIATRTH